MTYTGPTAESWLQLTATLDFSSPVGFTLGQPLVNGSDFTTPADPGLTSPGTVLSNDTGMMTPCAPAAIANIVTLESGSDIPMIEGMGPAALVSETIIDTQIRIIALNFTTLFETQPGVEYLFAIIEFQLAGNQGDGEVSLSFTPDIIVSGGNSVSNLLTSLIADTSDGYIRIMENQIVLIDL
jgi:hypothetical protein